MNEPNKDKIIELKDICIGWENRQVLDHVSLTVNRGDFIAITGPNGGGKTTLLRIILKLLSPNTGSVTYFNDRGEPTKKLKIGYLPQKNMIDSHFPISVREVIESGLLSSSDTSKNERQKLVNETIKTTGLEDKERSAIGQLSGGQLQRALLGRAIISEPKVLVLDEPLSYIDKRFESHLYDIMGELSRSTTIILVSHEMSTIAAMANRHFIVDGHIHECSAAHHFVHTECDE